MSETVSFGRRIGMLAGQHPGKTALVFAARDHREQRLSWAELDARSWQLARLLAGRGVEAGSLVAVALPNSPEHVLTTLATWKLGACVLPLRWDLPPWERQRLLQVAEPRLLVGDWSEPGVPSLSRAELEAADAQSADPFEDRVAEPALAIATSGSTGTPKLIVRPARGEVVLGDTESPFRTRDVPPMESQLVPAPLYHTNGFHLTRVSLLEDQLVVLMERFDAEQAVDLIERHRIGTVTMVPTMLLRIARLPDLARRDLSSLQALLQGGAPCPEWLVRTWIDRVGAERFYMSYGATEGVGLSVIRGDEWLARPGSVGRGTETEIRILDEQERALPPGEVGEIFMRSTKKEGPSFEYRGAPPARSTRDGFTSVGDLGWLDAQGYLFVADRRVDLIVSGGANVYPAEVEAALLEHPGVVDAAVIGLPDEEWGARVHALVQPADPARPPSEAELRAHCRERLATYKAPKSFEITERLPRSEAGKLSRSALIRERAAGPAGAGGRA